MTMQDENELEFVQKIQIRNVPPFCCNHLYCSDDITHFINVKICGMKIQISLCSEHAKELDRLYGNAKFSDRVFDVMY